MIRYVMDASCIGPLLLKDEAHLLIAPLTEALARSECIVPAHWRFEVANMVLVAIRRNRITPAHARAGLTQIASLEVTTDIESIEVSLDRTFELARAYKLTVYDAAYLELAQRLRLTLISTDGELVAAARNDGVDVLTQ